MKNIFEALGPSFGDKVAMEETASDHFEAIPTTVDPSETATFMDKLEDDHEGVNQTMRIDETLPNENVSDEIAREIEAIEQEGTLDENLSATGNDIMDIPENPKAEKMGGVSPAADDSERAPEVIEQIKENSQPNTTQVDDTGFAGDKEVEKMLAEQNGQDYTEHSDDQAIFSKTENETEVTSADDMYVQVPGDNGNDEFKPLSEVEAGSQGSTETNDTVDEQPSSSTTDLKGDDSTILDANSEGTDETNEESEPEEVVEEDSEETEDMEESEDEEEVAKEDVDTEVEDETEESDEATEDVEEDKKEPDEESEPETEEESESEETDEESENDDSEEETDETSSENEDGEVYSEVKEELALLDSVEIKGVLGGDDQDLETAKSNVSNQSEDSSSGFDSVSDMTSVNTAEGEAAPTEDGEVSSSDTQASSDSLASTVTELAGKDEEFDANKVTINRYDQVGDNSEPETIGDDVSSDDMGSPADSASDQGTEVEAPVEEDTEEEAPATESVELTWRQKMEMAIFNALKRK